MAPHAGKRASLTVAPGQCKPFGERFHSSRARPRRRALPTTDTELRLIASAAIIGLSSSPVNGYSTTAAIGTDRKSDVRGKSVSVRVDLGGRRILKKQKQTNKHTTLK